MANVDLGRYRRFVQMFWDPEPSNDTSSDQPVWCLGCSYRLSDNDTQRLDTVNGDTDDGTRHSPQGNHSANCPDPDHLPTRSAAKTPPGSMPSSLVLPILQEELVRDGSWPKGFLNDFSSRFWMTYRSGFEPIPKSSDPRANTTFSLPMRIKSQLTDQEGFSSDSGWGCMIRSGQSLLANTIGLLNLGRGVS